MIHNFQGNQRGYSSMAQRKHVANHESAKQPLNGNNNEKEVKIEEVRLQRTLGLPSGIALILGTIIGSGIFVSPKGVLEESGSVGLSLIVWTLGGIICLLGALCFAELGCLITKSGGQYSYVQETFGGFLAFLYLWASLIVIFPAANAVIALTFAQNLLQPFFPDCDSPAIAETLLAAAAIAILTWVNCVSVKWSARIQNVFTLIKTVALVIIIITGIVVLVMGKTENFNEPFSGTTTDPRKIALAFYSGLFSYSGWYTLNFLTEELKNPYKNLPRAILISMPLVTLIYVSANVAYIAVLGAQQLLASDAVAVSFAYKMYGPVAWIMPLLVACSTFGGLNGCILSVSRMFFVGAREGHLPDVLSLISMKYITPMPAVLFEGFFSILLLAIGDVYTLINCVSFLEALGFGMCTAGLLYLRYKWPDRHRPIKVNLVIAIIFLFICVFLVVFPLTDTKGRGLNDTLIGVAFFASGIPVYIVGIAWTNKPRWFKEKMKLFTETVQKLTNGVQQEGEVD